VPISQQSPINEPAYRSGTVARLTGIPVQTLRVWERRYNIVGPRQSTTGQRQYSPEDVTRLTVIKQLVDFGHAIGSLATLELKQLQSMLSHAARAARVPHRVTDPNAKGVQHLVRVAIVGDALAIRVRHYRLPALQIVVASVDVVHAFEASQGVAADVLLIELPTLQHESAQTVRTLAQQVGARQIIVEYGYGPRRFEQELRAVGCHLTHAPLNIDQLESLCQFAPGAQQIDALISLASSAPAAPRRFDNTTLAEISRASVTLNCECPRHISDLLVQVGNFETYSAECESRSPTDAALHRYLMLAAGNARALLEEALLRVVKAEGMALPP
jgi:MerR family transcriptional regulator, light-induced transcriptional regulator